MVKCSMFVASYSENFSTSKSELSSVGTFDEKKSEFDKGIYQRLWSRSNTVIEEEQQSVNSLDISKNQHLENSTESLSTVENKINSMYSHDKSTNNIKKETKSHVNFSNNYLVYNDNLLKAYQRAQFYKTRLCPYTLTNQKCLKESDCGYAHTVDELRPSINLTKTQLCQKLMAGICKKQSEECEFAHGMQDLRSTRGFYKTQLCKFWMSGDCPGGNFCRHAHGNQEFPLTQIMKHFNNTKMLLKKIPLNFRHQREKMKYKKHDGSNSKPQHRPKYNRYKQLFKPTYFENFDSKKTYLTNIKQVDLCDKSSVNDSFYLESENTSKSIPRSAVYSNIKQSFKKMHPSSPNWVSSVQPNSYNTVVLLPNNTPRNYQNTLEASQLYSQKKPLSRETYREDNKSKHLIEHNDEQLQETPMQQISHLFQQNSIDQYSNTAFNFPKTYINFQPFNVISMPPYTDSCRNLPLVAIGFPLIRNEQNELQNKLITSNKAGSLFELDFSDNKKKILLQQKTEPSNSLESGDTLSTTKSNYAIVEPRSVVGLPISVLRPI